MCSGSQNYGPSKTVNGPTHNICKKLNFNSGLCQFALQFFFSFMYGEVILMPDKTETVCHWEGCLLLLLLLMLYILKLILAYAK